MSKLHRHRGSLHALRDHFANYVIGSRLDIAYSRYVHRESKFFKLGFGDIGSLSADYGFCFSAELKVMVTHCIFLPR